MTMRSITPERGVVRTTPGGFVLSYCRWDGHGGYYAITNLDGAWIATTRDRVAAEWLLDTLDDEMSKTDAPSANGRH